MTRRRVNRPAQGVLEDAAEKWLRKNDPSYHDSKRAWAPPTTDALCRAKSETNDVHPTFQDIEETMPKGSGNYARSAIAIPPSDPIDNIQSQETGPLDD